MNGSVWKKARETREALRALEAHVRDIRRRVRVAALIGRRFGGDSRLQLLLLLERVERVRLLDGKRAVRAALLLDQRIEGVRDAHWERRRGLHWRRERRRLSNWRNDRCNAGERAGRCD